VLNWEGVTTNPNYTYKQEGWGPFVTNGKQTPFPNEVSSQHLDGSNYSFMDGHVKWYRPEQLSMDASGSGPTFMLH
jgi:prepilin-type processing-associated H-X9-DG protein